MLPNQVACLIALSALVAACEPQSLSVAGPRVSAPLFAISSGGGFRFETLASEAVCQNPDATSEWVSLPAGYTQQVLATQFADFAPVAGSGADLPDMMTLNETGPHAGRYMYRTHEVGFNGAVTVTDLWTGVTSLVVQQLHYERLDGIAWTPWGTLLFAEEAVTAARRDPDFPGAIRGLVYEYDPRTGVAVPRPAIGSRSHEGIRVDPQGNVYGISETAANVSGAVYKFVPDRRGDLSSGQLYALKVLDGTSRTGPAVWVALDRAASQIDSDTEARNAGATGWGRPEDVEIGTSTGNNQGGQQVLYVAVTSENKVIRIELHGDEASVSNYVEPGVNVDGEFENPDNLALDKAGSLYIAEDNGPGDIWVAAGAQGPEGVAQQVVRFASLSDCSGEPTGIYFDRNGHTLYVHIQHSGASSNDKFVAIVPAN